MAATRRDRRGAVEPGGHPLRPEVVAHHQRQRIIAGAARVIAERGYRSVSVADIVKSAAIARGSFYEHFGSKEDCFLALYETGTGAALEAVKEACSGESEGFPGRVKGGLAALLAYVESNREMAQACIVEGPAVGPAIEGRFEGMISSFGDLLRSGRVAPDASELPESVEETVVGGLYWLLYYALLEGKPKKVARLLPQLEQFSLIPFAGAEAADTAPTA